MDGVTQAVAHRSGKFLTTGTVPPARPPRVISFPTTDEESVPMTLADVPVHDFIGRWYAAKIKTREEKAFARNLAKRDVPYFLPQYTRKYKDAKGQKRTSRDARVPGYIFICGGSGEMGKVVDCRHFYGWVDLMGMLSCAAQDRLRRELETAYILAINEVDMHVLPYSHVANGQRVRICKGALRGIYGVITSMNHFAVKLSACDFAAEIEIDPASVEAA